MTSNFLSRMALCPACGQNLPAVNILAAFFGQETWELNKLSSVFRRLALKFHPDKGLEIDKAKLTSIFKLVSGWRDFAVENWSTCVRHFSQHAPFSRQFRLKEARLEDFFDETGVESAYEETLCPSEPDVETRPKAHSRFKFREHKGKHQVYDVKRSKWTDVFPIVPSNVDRKEWLKRMDKKLARGERQFLARARKAFKAN